jgi:hypothetical protein
LAMPEIGDDRFEQVAYIGTALAVKPDRRSHRFKFVRDPRFAAIPLATVQELSTELGIDGWELRRTHWAVKNIDLFEVFLAHQMGSQHVLPGNFGSSAAVHFPVDLPREPKLVAVMMPFAPEFDVVFETINAAVVDVGLTCVRADNIWEHHQVMGDILSILWRAQIVIADLSGRNANVFYETGLAHALFRDTILLTQNPSDVPFDLRSIRYLQYGLGTDQRAALRTQLAARLTTLAK